MELYEFSVSSDTNTKNAKMFKSEDNDKNNIVTSHLQLIGIKSSIMPGDTKAKEDARYIINCNILRGMSQNCVDLD